MSNKKGFIILSPLLVFIVLYLLPSIAAGDFYKVPITVAFMVSSIYAIAVSGGLPLAKRVQILREAFVHYRQDNESSSINSQSKVFCVCDEYAEIKRFLETNPFNRGMLECVCNRIKYDAYMWNFDRLSPKYRYLFVEQISREFCEDFKTGTMDSTFFEEYKWQSVKALVEDPVGWYTEKALNQPGYSTKELMEIKQSLSYRIGRMITFVPRKIKGGIQSVKDDGVVYTFKLACKKILRRLLWKEIPRSR